MEPRNFEIYTFGIGSILGALIGNAAGSYLNDPSKESIEAAFKLQGRPDGSLKPGEISDEGELLMSLLHSLMESCGVLDLNNIVKHYSIWGQRPKKSMK